ncbi:hypothetical protein HERIO_820 [Hepatospora eriocheir]|uniref:Uncharacterized protein n=1 Tax=Hepatospora eriocheir TaxID=1081669 RepID=A0A1X0QC22_9MICR|nr:hypothetical protein HERIO_820 [Hepatospora eriocheir]
MCMGHQSQNSSIELKAMKCDPNDGSNSDLIFNIKLVGENEKEDKVFVNRAFISGDSTNNPNFFNRQMKKEEARINK